MRDGNSAAPRRRIVWTVPLCRAITRLGRARGEGANFFFIKMDMKKGPEGNQAVREAEGSRELRNQERAVTEVEAELVGMCLGTETLFRNP